MVLILSQVFGVAADSEDVDAFLQVFDGVVAFLAAVGVYKVPNDPPPPAPPLAPTGSTELIR